MFRFNLNPILSWIDSHIIDYPTCNNFKCNWSFGSFAAFYLVIQILSGAFLAMHYAGETHYAFSSVKHIMRDVKSGWLIRYMYANGALFFFILVCAVIFRGSYREPDLATNLLVGLVFLLPPIAGVLYSLIGTLGIVDIPLVKTSEVLTKGGEAIGIPIVEIAVNNGQPKGWLASFGDHLWRHKWSYLGGITLIVGACFACSRGVGLGGESGTRGTIQYGPTNGNEADRLDNVVNWFVNRLGFASNSEEARDHLVSLTISSFFGFEASETGISIVGGDLLRAINGITQETADTIDAVTRTHGHDIADPVVPTAVADDLSLTVAEAIASAAGGFDGIAGGLSQATGTFVRAVFVFAVEANRVMAAAEAASGIASGAASIGSSYPPGGL